MGFNLGFKGLIGSLIMAVPDKSDQIGRDKTVDHVTCVGKKKTGRTDLNQ